MVMQRAIALIELIVAIIVMAIALTSVPIMIQSAEEEGEAMLTQEAVNLAATQLIEAMSHYWDEMQAAKIATEGYAKILDVNDNSNGSDAQAYARNPGTKYRKHVADIYGEHRASRRAFYAVSTMASTTLGPDSAEGAGVYDDVDDYNGLDYTLNATDAKDYKSNYHIRVSVDYISNDLDHVESSGQSSAIKRVRVQVTDSALDSNVTLQAFACDIGESRFVQRPLE